MPLTKQKNKKKTKIVNHICVLDALKMILIFSFAKFFVKLVKIDRIEQNILKN